MLSEKENTMDLSINGKLPGKRVLSEEGRIRAVSINVIYSKAGGCYEKKEE